jgi:hypothetical protein
MSNWNKDEMTKSFDFDEIGAVTSMAHPTELSVTVSGKAYEYHCSSPSEQALMIAIFRGIMANSLSVKSDDSVVCHYPGRHHHF